MKFIVTIFKCFLILVLFGIFLPKFLDYMLYYFMIKPDMYQNSLFVYSAYNKNIILLYNFAVVFNEFIKF